MKIAVVSLGCSKNLIDSQTAMKYLIRQGHTLITDPAKADVIVVNTCAFILDAKQESIDTILEMAEYKKKNCRYLFVMGCLSQRYKKELEEEMPEVDRFIAIDEYDRLEDIFREYIEPAGDVECDLVLATKPWSAYLRIADGCNNKCSFCAIPLIRGRYVSQPVEKLVEEARLLSEKGVKELNLIAQDTTKYGIDLYDKPSLDILLTKLNELDFHWIRVLYMYPDEINDQLLETIKSLDKVIPYFDIPSQHASDELLHKMKRASNSRKLKEIIRKIRELYDDPVLRSTVIVGFPSETKEDFEKLMAFTADIKWDRLGVFRYSLEGNTAAYDIHPRVSSRIAESRYDRLMTLQQNIVLENSRRYLNTVQEVLVEGKDAFGRIYSGRSRHFAPDDIDGHIVFTADRDLELGSFVKVRITDIRYYDFKGELIEQENK